MALVYNYTPHDVNVYHNTGNVEVFESRGLARCTQEEEYVGYIEPEGPLCIPTTIVRMQYGKVEGLPEPQDGVFYIVSSLVAQACKGKRSDLLVPADPVRDESGRIIGCRKFAIV